MDAIERIEVAVRSCFVNELSLKYGSHWYLSRAYFLPTYNHARLIRNIESNLEIDRATKTPSKKHQEVFINHYFSKYHTPYLPPIWMVCECLSFGTWSLMYSNLVDKADRKLVSDHFGVDVHLFLKWLTSLNQVRNICAHHGRFWNRQFSMKFDVLKVHRALVLGNDRFYAFAVICYFLLQGISPATDWNRKLYDLLGRFPHVDLSSMGFRPNWHLEPFWALY